MEVVSAKELRDAAQGLKVLYVEDDRDLRENTYRLLTSFLPMLQALKMVR
ncbi:MAG: hypothetical protein PHZ03_04170 [Syntrophomonas sp.]|nr:hypothetical protein [Syntrophomonas sp.]